MTDAQSERKSRSHARPRCLVCKKCFSPDPRVGHRQKYCSNKTCQSKRQCLHDAAWLAKPENIRFRALYQRRWRENNPEHLKLWRKTHPESVRQNRRFMRGYMQRKRRQPLFEKTRQIHLQVTKDKGDMYVNRRNTWIFLRLRRQGRWSRALADGYACRRIRSDPVRLPQGRLYKLSGSA